ncbi:MAG: DMT family transporter [Phenylobacterium sp.]|jgi:drug/metabolite transporter (DMT)-like permease|uniref:DMT family transporter n=1 Tax=Phenylobacterium sp. TaxID=1871053 RepID=UPI002A3655E1|nr:DMT family transporter [Phenylobacterium sp.]MDX9997392.1 DMT family transporter [Phenylobacterium sp.]
MAERAPAPPRAPGLSRLHDQPYALLVLTTLAWGGNAVAGRLAVGEIAPMALTAGRWGLVVAVLGLFARRQVGAGLAELRRHWRSALAMGAAGFTAFNALFYVAAHHTSAVNISIIQGSIPVLVMLGALLLHRTPVRPGQAVGMVMTLAGVALVASHGDLASLAGLRLNVGDLYMLIACALYAGYTLALRGRAGIGGLSFFAGLAAAAFVTSLPLLAIEAATGQGSWPTPIGWAVLVYVALFPSFVAQVFYMRAVELIGPGRAGLFINLVPVFGALLAVLILSEPFGLHHAGALALVLAGIFVAERSAGWG